MTEPLTCEQVEEIRRKAILVIRGPCPRVDRDGAKDALALCDGWLRLEVELTKALWWLKEPPNTVAAQRQVHTLLQRHRALLRKEEGDGSIQGT